MRLAHLSWVYAFLAFINLRAKLWATSAWRDGTLSGNHQLLLDFQYGNNEQSRLLQWMIPEAIHRFLGTSIQNAYLLQRWFFVFLAFVAFHAFLRRWFDDKIAFAGVVFLSAVMPLTYMNYLQESAPLLMVTFLLALWAIRDHRPVIYAGILLLGTLNNETMLVLPAVFFFYNFEGFRWGHLLKLAGRTIATCLPAYAVAASIRIYNIERPHLGGAWHLPDNWNGIMEGIQRSPFEYWNATYLYVFFLFGAFWVFALLRFKEKPLFLRRAWMMIPLYFISHMLTGIISESRQMIPLSFIIIPMALTYLFSERAEPAYDLRKERSEPPPEDPLPVVVPVVSDDSVTE